ncbi:MAG: hypothetical protein ABI591_15205 [Kofleriaceae bacterium]
MKPAALVVLTALAAWSSTAFAGPTKSAPKKQAPAEPPAKPFPSGSDHRRIVGILDVRIDGAPPEVGAQFQRDLEAQVDNAHYFLAPRVRMHDRMANSTKWTEGCVIGGCLREVKTQTGADVVLLAALTGSGTSFGWVVTLVGTNKGVVVGQESERCDVCTVSEALNAATLATIKLLDNIPDVLDGEAKPIGPPPTKALEDSIATMRHTQKVAGTSLVVAGLAVAAAGAAYYFARDRDKNGLAIAGVGGGALIGGVITLAF